MGKQREIVTVVLGRFYECEYGHCRSDFRCDAGYRGRMCSELIHEEYFTLSVLPPMTCPESAAARGALVLFGYAVLVGVWLHVNSAYLARYRVLLVYIYFLQIMAVVMRFNYENLPNHAPPVQVVRMLLDLSLFDFAVFMPTCVLELTELGAFGLQFLFIFFGFAFLFLPVLREMFTKFVEEWSYRNWEAIKKSLDFYEGDFGEKIYRRIGVFLTLVDVQRPLEDAEAAPGAEPRADAVETRLSPLQLSCRARLNSSWLTMGVNRAASFACAGVSR